MAKADIVPSNRPTLDSLTTAQLIERAQQCIEAGHADLSRTYALMSALMERQREFDSRRPAFNVELDSVHSSE